MAKADGTIVIDTEIQTDDAVAGAKKIESTVGDLGVTLRDFGENVEDAFEGLADHLSQVDEEATAHKNRIMLLTAEYDAAKAKVSELTRKFNESASATGITSEETAKLHKELAQAEKEAAKAEKELKKYSESVEDIGDEASKAEKELDDCSEVIEDIGDEASKAEKELDDCSEVIEDIGDEAAKADEKLDDYNETVEDSGKKTEQAGERVEKGSKKFSAFFKIVAKGAAAALGAAASGIIAITKQAVDAFSDYEQLSGGVEKIFNEMDTSKILADADKAYKDLSLSANRYLAIINDVGATFAATMGDEAGYNTARQGLLAISDYASGTGKSVDELSEKFTLITRSTSVYQSIADQFSGILPATSKDFLAQAQAAGLLSKKYKQLTDVPVAEYQAAISAMLEKGVADLGLAGNTAAEAATTISGSLAAVKAMWSNLLVAISQGDSWDIGVFVSNFTETLVNAFNNLAPVIQGALVGIGAVIEGIAPIIGEKAPGIIAELLPSLISAATALLNGLLAALPELLGSLDEIVPMLVNAIVTALPLVTNAAFEIMTALLNGLLDSAPMIIPEIVAILIQIVDTLISRGSELQAAGITLINAVLQGLITAIPQIIAAIPTLINSILTAFTSDIGMLFEGALTLFNAIVTAIPMIIPPLMAQLPSIIQTIVSVLTQNVQTMINGALTLFNAIVAAIPMIIPYIVEALPDIIEALTSGLVDNLPLLIDAAISLLNGIILAFPTILEALTSELPSIISTIVTALLNAAPQILGAAIEALWSIIKAVPEILDDLGETMSDLGGNIVEGIWSGISAGYNWIKSKIEGWVGNVLGFFKDILGIHSPSTVMRDLIGKQMAAGIGVGFEAQIPKELDAMKKALNVLSVMPIKVPYVATGKLIPPAATVAAARHSTMITEYRSQSSATSTAQTDLLSEIRALGDRIANMQVVLDTGRTVGGLLSETDRQLGGRQILTARGVS